MDAALAHRFGETIARGVIPDFQIDYASLLIEEAAQTFGAQSQQQPSRAEHILTRVRQTEMGTTHGTGARLHKTSILTGSIHIHHTKGPQ